MKRQKRLMVVEGEEREEAHGSGGSRERLHRSGRLPEGQGGGD